METNLIYYNYKLSGLYNNFCEKISKFSKSVPKITSLITLDRLAEMSIATCVATGGIAAFTNSTSQGIKWASFGSAAVCTIWGTTSIIRGNKTKGAKVLLIGIALLVLGLMPELKSQLYNQTTPQDAPTTTSQDDPTTTSQDDPTTTQPDFIPPKEVPATERKQITFGTTYVKVNPDRDRLSEAVDNNHREYAKIWNLKHRVVDQSLLKDQCADPNSFLSGKKVDCVPYWNKVALLRNWLATPVENKDKEEWYIIADDDMPVTNMRVNPYQAIDELRRGKDTSIIVTQDVIPWKDNDPQLSVNTGLLFVRKDEQSRRLIEDLWNRRDTPTTINNPKCQTLGTCQNQDVLHEQEALAQLLKNDRSLYDRVISVVKPRDFYSDAKGYIKELALNTFNRAGCFIRSQKGWSERAFNYDFDNQFPEGKWRKGDWMGQPTGIPIFGWNCHDYIQGTAPTFIREDRIKQMIQSVVKPS
jgi:hypothetical protein